MTIIRPNQKRNFISLLALFITLPLLSGVIWLILIYNHTVNLRHDISTLKSSFEKVQAENAELNDSLFAFFDSKNLEKLASERQLVKEKQPEYLEIPRPWEFASQQ